MNVLLVADTHLGAAHAGRLIDTLGDLLVDADEIIHAGDITDPAVLRALEIYAPVRAVLGNNDRAMTLPERLLIDVGGCSIGVVHDSGPATGRAARLRRWFPDADVVVFGHSHLPWHEVDRRVGDGHAQHQINPGSAIQRRRAPRRTAAVVEIAAAAVVAVRHVPLT
ncbi:MAG: Phosphoesterase [Ilumatobacteraceae bacterium]|nr:Phosphoesterase [Ilumatobacteraceae bacterium]